MSKKLYSVSINFEKEFNHEQMIEEVKNYSFSVREQEIVGETYEYFNVKYPESTFISQVSKFKEFTGPRIILPEDEFRFGEHSTNVDLIPEMKKHLVSALILEIQKKYQKMQMHIKISSVIRLRFLLVKNQIMIRSLRTYF